MKVVHARIRPFRDGDIAGLDLHPAQARDFAAGRMADTARMLADHGRSFTLFSDEGRVLLIAGVARIDESYGHCWAFMSAHAGRHMAWLTRKVRSYLDGLMGTHRRIEMMVRADFAPGRRWAVLLGFACEGPLQCAAPDGGDMLRYARVNPGAVT